LIGSKISRRYAKALFSLGEGDGQYVQYGKNLEEFALFCKENDEFFRVISSRLFPVEDREKILEDILKKSNLTEMVSNFLKLLIDKSRIGAISEISEYYSKLTDEISNITRAEIFTAKPLQKDALSNLEKALSSLVSKEVKTEVKEDKALIGGLLVKIGDLVLDGSVRAQLEGLKESLKRGEYN
jgi:F-type H+-transporting ATPase subunit delta